MNITDFFALGSACFGILMLGSVNLRLNLFLYSLQTLFMALATINQSFKQVNIEMYFICIFIIALKALFIPYFLNNVLTKIDIQYDSNVMIPTAIGMHISILFLGISQLLSDKIIQSMPSIDSIGGVTAAISLLFTGILFMLLRKIAISQIIGFLTLENGIFIFGVSITKGLPLIVDLGVLLDLLVAIMIAGLFVFRIKSSFEHIDVTQLNELHEN